MTVIVAATSNPHKLSEYHEMLADQKVEIASLLDYPDFRPSAEDGRTFRENAAKKALEACVYTDLPAFADDSGLEVTALGGAPGIYSSRYGKDDADRIGRVLRELDGKSDRSARFVCVIALAYRGDIVETFRGEVTGTIAPEPRGTEGFGYDPIFIPDGYDRTFGELGEEVKSKLSHRARAFALAAEFVHRELQTMDDFEFV